MKPSRQLLLCLWLFLSLGCSEDIPLPPANPLAVDDAIIDQLYGINPGPHAVSVVRNQTLSAASDQRDLLFNLYFPTAGSGFPLLLFSHGNWSDKDSYDRLIEHWVSHGYAVIAPNHLDCCGAPKGIFNSLRYGQLGLIEGRVDDLSRLLQELPAIEAIAPAFRGKADPSKLAVTGHSFGAFSAQQFGGAAAFDPDQQKYLPHRDPQVKAIVALSPPGPMFDTITADSWLELETPTLISTGTWDIQPAFWPDWRMHLMSWETAIAGNKYALVTEGADHFLGNLICRTEREATPQTDALRMVHSASTAFLDAYLKDSTAARAFIDSDTIGEQSAGFSRLDTR
ncbi:MAG: alpha/beta fold hydrolase [Halioglobus sp.]